MHATPFLNSASPLAHLSAFKIAVFAEAGYKANPEARKSAFTQLLSPEKECAHNPKFSISRDPHGCVNFTHLDIHRRCRTEALFSASGKMLSLKISHEGEAVVHATREHHCRDLCNAHIDAVIVDALDKSERLSKITTADLEKRIATVIAGQQKDNFKETRDKDKLIAHPESLIISGVLSGTYGEQLHEIKFTRDGQLDGASCVCKMPYKETQLDIRDPDLRREVLLMAAFMLNRFALNGHTENLADRLVFT